MLKIRMNFERKVGIFHCLSERQTPPPMSLTEKSSALLVNSFAVPLKGGELRGGESVRVGACM